MIVAKEQRRSMAIDEPTHAESQALDWDDVIGAAETRSEKDGIRKTTSSRTNVNFGVPPTTFGPKLLRSRRMSTGRTLEVTANRAEHNRVSRAANINTPEIASSRGGVDRRLLPTVIGNETLRSLRVPTGRALEVTANRGEHSLVSRAANINAPEITSSRGGVDRRLLPTVIGNEALRSLRVPTGRALEVTANRKKHNRVSRAANINAPEITKSRSDASRRLLPTIFGPERLRSLRMSIARNLGTTADRGRHHRVLRAANTNIPEVTSSRAEVNLRLLPIILECELSRPIQISTSEPLRTRSSPLIANPRLRTANGNASKLAILRSGTKWRLLLRILWHELLGLPRLSIARDLETTDKRGNQGLVRRAGNVSKIAKSRSGVKRRWMLRIPARELLYSLRMSSSQALATRDRLRNGEPGARVADANDPESTTSRGRASRRLLPRTLAGELLSETQSPAERAVEAFDHRRTHDTGVPPASSSVPRIESLNRRASPGSLVGNFMCELLGPMRIPMERDRSAGGYRERANPTSRAGSASTPRIAGSRVSANANVAPAATQRNVIRRDARTSVAQHTRRVHARRTALGESVRCASAQALAAIRESSGPLRVATLAGERSNIPPRRWASDSRVLSRTAARQGLPPRFDSPPMPGRATSSAERAPQSKATADHLLRRCHRSDARGKRHRDSRRDHFRVCGRPWLQRSPAARCIPEGTRWRAARIEAGWQPSRAEAQSVRCPAPASIQESSGRAAHQLRTRSTRRGFPETPCANSTQGSSATALRIPATSANISPSNRAAGGWRSLDCLQCF